MPIFSRWNYGPILPGHSISVFDPTMELSPVLTCGWYLGTRSHDVTTMVVELARKVAAHLGITDLNVAFFSSSAGALTALLCAGGFPGATCLIQNPLLDITLAPPDKQHEITRVFAPELTSEQMFREYKKRTSAIAAFELPSDLPVIVWAQDTNDPYRANIIENSANVSAWFERGEPAPMVACSPSFMS